MKANRIYLKVPVIINLVADHLNVLPDEVISVRRNREFIKAKHIAMYFSHEFTPLSFAEIGLHFNGKDHSTISHAIKSVRNQKEIYTSYRNEIDQIEKELERHAVYDRDFVRYESYDTDNT